MGDLSSVCFLFMPNKTNILTFQKHHKFVTDAVLRVVVIMTDNTTRLDHMFIQPMSGHVQKTFATIHVHSKVPLIHFFIFQ